MNFKYFPHTPGDIAEMLARCGVKDIDALYSDVPEEVRLKGDYDLPEAKSEAELRAHFAALGKKNTPLTCFAGAGVYDHYIPAVVPSICARSERVIAREWWGIIARMNAVSSSGFTSSRSQARVSFTSCRSRKAVPPVRW